MTTEINIRTAVEWLKDRYKNVPGIWEQFDIYAAADSLADAMPDIPSTTEMCGDKPAVIKQGVAGIPFCNICDHADWDQKHWWRGNYDDLPVLDLMCIMADSKM